MSTTPAKEKTKKVKKTSRAITPVPRGKAYVHATYNNTIINVADLQGNILGWSSAGKMGFSGPKKATPYAAGVVVKDLLDKIAKYGVREVQVFIKGVGAGREGAVRAFHANGLNILSIHDVTPVPHNGCRPPKVRRI